MAVDLSVPEWLAECVQEWAQILGLSGWKIKLLVALAPGDDPDCLGHTAQYPDLNTAIVTISAEAQDTPYWHLVVVHELLHVAHARIDALVEQAIIEQLPGPAGELATRVYHQQVEAYTHGLACALCDSLANEANDEATEQG